MKELGILNQNHRDISIDMIKIAAMYMIIMIHTGVVRSGAGYSGQLWPYVICNSAIPLFFIVSGFLLSNKKDISYKYPIKKIWGIIKFCMIICFGFDIIKYVSTGCWDWSFPLCFIKEGTFSVFWYFGSMIILYAFLPILNRIINSKYLNKVLLIMFLICFVVFILNVLCNFEKSVINTFRVVNWFFYFLLGAKLQKIKCPPQQYNIWLLLIILISSFCVLYLGISYSNFRDYELWFPSPICIVYSISWFMLIKQACRARRLSLFANISKLFLPMYAIHMSIIWRLCRTYPIRYIESIFSDSVSFIVEFIIFSIVCTIISMLIMKLPYSNRIFKI